MLYQGTFYLVVCKVVCSLFLKIFLFNKLVATTEFIIYCLYVKIYFSECDCVVSILQSGCVLGENKASLFFTQE
jgi:hypothetical protein